MNSKGKQQRISGIMSPKYQPKQAKSVSPNKRKVQGENKNIPKTSKKVMQGAKMSISSEPIEVTKLNKDEMEIDDSALIFKDESPIYGNDDGTSMENYGDPLSSNA